MIYIDDCQKHELALIIKYTFIIVSRAPIPTVSTHDGLQTFKMFYQM